MSFNDFEDSEFQKKLQDASTPQELQDLAKEAGCELSDEQLNGVSGGDICANDCTEIKWCLEDVPANAKTS